MAQRKRTVVLSLDYDNCMDVLFEKAALRLRRRNKTKELEVMNSVREKLHQDLQRIIAGANRVIVMVGSNRQSVNEDYINRERLQMEIGPIDDQVGWVRRDFEILAEQKGWELNRALLADKENNVPPGTAWDNDGLQIESGRQEAHTKQSLIQYQLEQLHSIEGHVDFYFFDDRADLLDFVRRHVAVPPSTHFFTVHFDWFSHVIEQQPMDLHAVDTEDRPRSLDERYVEADLDTMTNYSLADEAPGQHVRTMKMKTLENQEPKLSISSSRSEKDAGGKSVNSNTEKSVYTAGEESSQSRPHWGYACRKGLKADSPNQDSWFAIRTEELQVSIYGVLDGHGGWGHDVSDYVAKHLPPFLAAKDRFLPDSLTDEEKNKARKNILRESFNRAQGWITHATDASVIDAEQSGTTLTAVIHDEKMKHLVVAHVGDSRACLGSVDKDSGKLTCTVLLQDHKPDVSEEKARIEYFGGEVRRDSHAKQRIYCKGTRFPGLNMSRTLGDLRAHQSAGLSAEPTISDRILNPEDEILLICSDGVWDFIHCDEALRIVQKFHPGEAMQAAQALAQEAWRRWIKNQNGERVDDITVLVIYLQSANSKQKLESGVYVETSKADIKNEVHQDWHTGEPSYEEWQEWSVPFSDDWQTICEEWLGLAVQLAGNADGVFLVDCNGQDLGFGRSADASTKPQLLFNYSPEVFPLRIQFYGAQMSWEPDWMAEFPDLSFSSSQPTAQKPNETRQSHFSTGAETDATNQINQIANDMVDAIAVNTLTLEEALVVISEEYDAESASVLSLLITNRIKGNGSEGFVEGPAQNVVVRADTAYGSEAYVSAICIADPQCKGYVLHKNGEFYLLDAGAHTYTTEEEWLERVMVKHLTQASTVDSSGSARAEGEVGKDIGFTAPVEGSEGVDVFDAGSFVTVPLVSSPRSVPTPASPRNKARDLQLLESAERSRLGAMRLAATQEGTPKKDEACHRRDDLLGIFDTAGQPPTDHWQTMRPNRTGAKGKTDTMGISERTIGQLAKPSRDVSMERPRSSSTADLGVFWIALWDSVVCRPECQYNACRDLWSCDEEEDFRDAEDLREVEGEGITRVLPIVPTFQTRLVNDFSDGNGPWDNSLRQYRVDIGLCCSIKHRTP